MIVILTESEHSVFKRKKADLVMTKTITLKQALTGFSFDITHLDGSTKIIRSSEGDVIKPGDVRTIMELGMPIMRTPWRFGNLFIYYEVEFPAPGSLSLEQRQALLQALPGENMDLEAQEGQETHSAVPFEKQHVTENSTRIHSDYNEDEEDDDPRFSGARQVQCSGTIF